MLAGFIKTMQTEEIQSYKNNINIFWVKTEKWREKNSNILKIHKWVRELTAR